MDQQYVYFALGSSPVNSSFMNNEDSGTRLRWCLSDTGHAPSDLAQFIGVSNQTVNNWFVRGVPGRKILQVAKFFDVRPQWLQTGEGSPLDEKELADVRRIMDASPENRAQWVREVRESHPAPAQSAYSYPEVPWGQAAGYADPDSLKGDSGIKWHSSDAWAGYRGFWIRVMGSSMSSGGDITFPPGSLVLVDPEEAIEPGQFVVARQKHGPEITFKQLVRDAGELYLKPLNPTYPIKALNDDWEIIGTVVDGKMPESFFRALTS
jgi:SOS-response transcriptional repressor LexA